MTTNIINQVLDTFSAAYKADANQTIVINAKDLRARDEAFISSLLEVLTSSAIEAEPTPNDLMTTEELKKVFKVSDASLWRWKMEGYLVPVKVGRRNYYKREDIEALTKK